MKEVENLYVEYYVKYKFMNYIFVLIVLKKIIRIILVVCFFFMFSGIF